MLGRRLQVLVDDRLYERLAAWAKERNLSVGHVVREAIDQAVPAPAAERARAARRILSAEAMEASPPAELRRELDELRARRA